MGKDSNTSLSLALAILFFGCRERGGIALLHHAYDMGV